MYITPSKANPIGVNSIISLVRIGRLFELATLASEILTRALDEILKINLDQGSN